MKVAALIVLVAASPAALAFEANGLALGAREIDVKKAFPSAHCKALEWKTSAADRRCDDGRIAFGGVQARITVYLRGDAVQAFDLRFETKDRNKVAAHAKARWGAPLSEVTEEIGRKNKEGRQVYKVRWEKGNEHAVLTAQLERKRGSLEAWRGNFSEEIYRVR
jgi:hypothetical protein